MRSEGYLSKKIARKYSKCIFEVHNSLFQKDFEILTKFLNDNPKILKDFFCNSSIPSDLKNNIFEMSCKNSAFITFIRILLRNNDFHIIQEIISEYKNILSNVNNEIHVEVKVAKQVLYDEQINLITYIVKKHTNKNAIIKIHFDESIISGFIASFDGKIIDCSLNTVLSSFKKLSTKVIIGENY